MKFQTPFFAALIFFWFAILLFVLKNTDAQVSLPLTSLFLYFLLCLGYVAESTALENESPSMRIIKSILKNKGRVSPEELKAKFTDQEFIHDRLGDLVSNGHVECEGGNYRLTKRGSLIAGIVKSYRDLIKRGLGG